VAVRQRVRSIGRHDTAELVVKPSAASAPIARRPAPAARQRVGRDAIGHGVQGVRLLESGSDLRAFDDADRVTLRHRRGMPRPPRVVLPGHTLHLIQRGNNRAACFVDDADRERFLAMLLHVSERTRCAIHAYVLMTNHTHLLVTAQEARAPARMMQTLGRSYVRYFNDRHARTGTLWEGRYRSSLLDTERYFLQCSRYIEANPVRAGLVTSPEEYRWSSFRGNAKGPPDPLVSPHPVYLALGRSASTRREAYRALFGTPLAPPELDAIRRATNQGLVLGFDDRRSELERTLGQRLSRSTHGGDRRSPAAAAHRRPRRARSLQGV